MIFFSPCDMPVAEAFVQWRTMGGTLFFINLSEVAGPAASTGLVAIASLGLFALRRHALLGGLLFTAAGANASWYLLKALVARPRPALELTSFIEPGYAFPSGHATNAFALATFFAVVLYHLVPRGGARLAAIAAPLVLAALVAFARVYLGVHYVSDVVAGALIGTAFGLGGFAFSQWLLRRARR